MSGMGSEFFSYCYFFHLSYVYFLVSMDYTLHPTLPLYLPLSILTDTYIFIIFVHTNSQSFLLQLTESKLCLYLFMTYHLPLSFVVNYNRCVLADINSVISFATN